ncbi:MAG TPA: YigZ family protein [Lachnospiraceae bacterium]|nr:YigZ family protein [uncultured Lachnoclostridium sp.]HAU85313.1 YigZ family protein [Lachnospiraceae bacterium]
MKEQVNIVYRGGQGEIVEKKSRFICTVLAVNTEDEAIVFIEKMRKQYWDATHNCFAYVIGERQQIQRCSDDGEPSGTAGRPMLDVLLGNKLSNAAVVVTRYFGGTLLGTGGLVRAYSKSTQVGLENSVVFEKCCGKQVSISTDYNGIGKLQYIAATMELHTLDTEYTDKVVVKLLVPEDKLDEMDKKVTEATSGKAKIEIEDTVYYGIHDKEVIIL